MRFCMKSCVVSLMTLVLLGLLGTLAYSQEQVLPIKGAGQEELVVEHMIEGEIDPHEDVIPAEQGGVASDANIIEDSLRLEHYEYDVWIEELDEEGAIIRLVMIMTYIDGVKDKFDERFFVTRDKVREKKFEQGVKVKVRAYFRKRAKVDKSSAPTVAPNNSSNPTPR